MIGGRTGEWHWLWDAYVLGMCAAAAAGVVMLDDRFPSNVPVALAALAGIVVCVSAFGRRVIRGANSIGEHCCFSRRYPCPPRSLLRRW